MGNSYFNKSYIETNHLIESVNQLSGFFPNMLPPKRNFQKHFCCTVSVHKTSTFKDGIISFNKSASAIARLN